MITTNKTATEYTKNETRVIPTKKKSKKSVEQRKQ